MISDGGHLISIEMGARRCCPDVDANLYFYMNVHFTSYGNTLVLFIYCLPLHPGTWQVNWWGLLTQDLIWPYSHSRRVFPCSFGYRGFAVFDLSIG